MLFDSWDRMDYILPRFSVHRISQARILEWVAISFSRGSSWPREWTHISCMQADSLSTNHQGSPVSQFRHSVMFDSLRPHGLQYTRLPCPSPIPRACSNSCASSQWCHPTISPSVVPFSICLQSFPASGSFPMSQFFASGDQSIGVSASASVLPMNI